MSPGKRIPSVLRGVTARAGAFRSLPYVVGLGVPLLLVWSLFGGYVCDDDLIMLRYAERLADGRGLTWNDGEYAHAVTAGLLVVVTALFRWAGLSMEVGASLLSVLGTLGSASLVVAVARRQGVGRWYAACLGGALVLAAPFAVWSFAGVGGGVFAAVAGWAVMLVTEPQRGDTPSSRRLGLVALLLVLLQVVRPDALVVVLPVLVLLLLQHPFRRRVALVVAVPVLASAVALFGAQAWYFRTPVPHVALVKISPDLSLLRVGLLYVLEFVRGFAPLLLLAAWSLYRSRSSFRTVAIAGPLVVVATWMTYLVWVGGDWMPANRHFALVVLLLLVALLRLPVVTELQVPGKHGVRLRTLLLPVALLSSALSLMAPATDRARDAQKWMDECVEGSTALGEVFGEVDPLLAVEPAGCPPYVTGFRSLDMLGLLDVTISRASPAGRPVSWDEWQRSRNSRGGSRGAGTFIPGHGNGDGTYVWGREPDLVVTCDPVNADAAGCFRSWSELESRFDVASRYRVLAIDVGSGNLWKVWVRHDGGRTGVRYGEPGSTQVTVPSWLLGGLDAPLRRTTSGVLRPVLRAGGSVDLPTLQLTSGRWVVDGLPTDAVVGIAPSSQPAGAVCASVSTRIVDAAPSVVVSGSAGCDVSLRMVSSSEVPLDGVVLRLAP